MVWEFVASSAITAIVLILAMWKYWSKAKAKLHAIVVALDEVDRALLDDRIDENEFREIFDKFRKVVIDP